MLTVREFIQMSYRLISADSPTVPLHGSDLSVGIFVLNQLLESYAATGLMLTISQDATLPLTIGQKEIICGPPTHIPTPDIPLGRLANLENAWLLLNGVTYPLIIEQRAEFLSAWKYDPLQSLPRFIMVFPETEVTRLRIYPAASQFYEFNLRAKFQLGPLTANDTMDIVPQYQRRFLSLAVAKDISMYKGRMEAWTPPLEAMLQAERDNIIATSEVNLSITGERDSLLNGKWAVMAGVS